MKTDLNALADLAVSDTRPLLDLFKDEPDRADRLRLNTCGLMVDFSKQRVSKSAFDALMETAKTADVVGARAAFFAGEKINTSEDRAVLHPALRGSAGSPDIRAEVETMRRRTREFCEKIIDEGKFKTVVHIGIGGSDLGPRLCAAALTASYAPALALRFAHNVDGASINQALDDLDPNTTLVISVSKSFTTQETLMNTEAAYTWLKSSLGAQAGDHMIAVTANREGAEKFGIAASQIFDFWDWVGGRFSLWSAVSLSLQIAYGPDVFDDLLAGANAMDMHFLEAPMDQNLPILMGLIGIWNRNALGYPTLAVVPYARRLQLFPSFLQQLEMESNGKAVRKDGEHAGITCPTLWGDEGTNGQHAFFQHLHQSPDVTPVDFVGVLTDHENLPEHHKALLANCIAQSEALMVGKSGPDIPLEKSFAGNRPSTTIMLDRLDAKSLGALIALYEHKVFVQGVIWGINSFDQWGVQLGKVLAQAVLEDLDAKTPSAHDASTNQLIALVRSTARI